MSQKTPNTHEINRYAEAYVATGNSPAAWRKTYPKSLANGQTAAEKACRMSKMPAVVAKVEALQVVARQSVSVEFTITIADKKRLLAKVAQMGLDKAKSLSAVVAAVAELNRMDGHHPPPKAPVGPNGLPAAVIVANPTTVEEYKKIRDEMMAFDDC